MHRVIQLLNQQLRDQVDSEYAQKLQEAIWTLQKARTIHISMPDGVICPACSKPHTTLLYLYPEPWGIDNIIGYFVCPVTGNQMNMAADVFPLLKIISMQKIADIVLFFFQEEEKEKNNYGKIAPAIVNAVWSDTTLNVTIIPDGGSDTIKKSSLLRAETIQEAYAGNRWASKEQAEAWGIKLDDTHFDMKTLLPAVNESNEQASESAGEDKVAED